MAVLRVCEYAGFSLLVRNQIFPGSESRARVPVLAQAVLYSAYFQTQYAKQPSCGLQARGRPGLAFVAPPRRVPGPAFCSTPSPAPGISRKMMPIE